MRHSSAALLASRSLTLGAPQAQSGAVNSRCRLREAGMGSAENGVGATTSPGIHEQYDRDADGATGRFEGQRG
jgi:hypothetical protein